MNDPLVVRCFEGFGYLSCNGQRLVYRNRASYDSLRQILAFDQLHHERVAAVRLLKPVDDGDVGMVQSSECLGFAFKPSNSIRVLREGLWQHFDRNLPTEVGIRRSIDFAHTTGA